MYSKNPMHKVLDASRPKAKSKACRAAAHATQDPHHLDASKQFLTARLLSAQLRCCLQLCNRSCDAYMCHMPQKRRLCTSLLQCCLLLQASRSLAWASWKFYRQKIFCAPVFALPLPPPGVLSNQSGKLPNLSTKTLLKKKSPR